MKTVRHLCGAGAPWRAPSAYALDRSRVITLTPGCSRSHCATRLGGRSGAGPRAGGAPGHQDRAIGVPFPQGEIVHPSTVGVATTGPAACGAGVGAVLRLTARPQRWLRSSRPGPQGHSRSRGAGRAAGYAAPGGGDGRHTFGEDATATGRWGKTFRTWSWSARGSPPTQIGQGRS